MIVQGLAFYIFSAVTLAAAVMVISARNPVHSVFFLILAFFNSAALFILLGAEFIAMILVIVYVGAVAVLFLFVVMMLDINVVKVREGFLQYLPLGALIGLIFVIELGLVIGAWAFSPEAAAGIANPTPIISETTNTHALGEIIYTKYVYLFQAAGIVLLIAMVGAIVLTLRSREGVRRQKIGEQIARKRDDVIEIRDVPTGSGV